MKNCKKCKQSFVIIMFYKHPRMADGHLNFCKSCTKKRIKIYDQSPQGRLVQKRRNQKRAANGHFSRLTKKMRAQYPEKYKARNAVSNALRDGQIIKQPCQKCGNGNLKEVEAHHEDYSKPLEVIWLCRRGTKNNCHVKQHFIS